MKMIVSLLFLAAVLVGPGESAELRSTSVQHELNILWKIFEEALNNYDLVYASLTENCPDACPDGECEDGCLYKLLQQYEERLRALQAVVLTLEKLACKECPGTFLTTLPVVEIPAAGTSGLDSSPQVSEGGSSMADSFETVLVGSNGHLYRQIPEKTYDLIGMSRSVIYDPYKSNLYSVEEKRPENSVCVIARSVLDGEPVGNFLVVYSSGGRQPVDISGYGPDHLAVITVDATSTEIELITKADMSRSSILDEPVGDARRITTNYFRGKIYYTRNDGVYEYDVAANNNVRIVPVIGAVGIDYYDNKVYFCREDSGELSWYDTIKGELEGSELKSFGGCSDLVVKGLRPSGSPTATRVIHFFVASTDHKVIDFIKGKPDGVHINIEYPETRAGERASITFLYESDSGRVNLG